MNGESNVANESGIVQSKYIRGFGVQSMSNKREKGKSRNILCTVILFKAIVSHAKTLRLDDI